MYHLKQLSVWVKKTAKGRMMVALIAFFAICPGCRNDLKGPDPSEKPFLDIADGRFDVRAIVVREDSSKDLGSGSLSFNFSGDISGTYSISGHLESIQKNNDGVGAVITLIEDVDFGRLEEGLSLLAFHPIGNGNADVFVLGTKPQVSFDSIKAGDAFAIGPDLPFNGLYLTGVNIDKFWAGTENLLETADRAFIIILGLISIATRDSTRITGTFFGTTDPNRSRLPKHIIPTRRSLRP